MDDRWRDTYDAWKLRSPDDEAERMFGPQCEDLDHELELEGIEDCIIDEVEEFDLDQEQGEQMTFGETRVRISFNPSASTEVEDIKRRAADAIDWCASKLRDRTQGWVEDDEVNRCLSLAMTHFEAASMWAVKAVTAPPSPKPSSAPTGTATSTPQAIEALEPSAGPSS